MKPTAKQNIGYLALALIILIIMLLLLPTTTYKPKGVVLATTKQQYQATNTAKVFDSLPQGYKQIGIVNITLHADKNKINQQAVINAALQKVAKNGGDGLIIKQSYYLAPAQYGKISGGYHLLAEVIKKGGSHDS